MHADAADALTFGASGRPTSVSASALVAMNGTGVTSPNSTINFARLEFECFDSDASSPQLLIDLGAERDLSTLAITSRECPSAHLARLHAWLRVSRWEGGGMRGAGAAAPPAIPCITALHCTGSCLACFAQERLGTPGLHDLAWHASCGRSSEAHVS